MTFHPDVLAAHAEFGGDLVAMQALYDRPDHIKRIATLERQIAELQAGNAEHSRKWLQAEQDLLAAEAENARLRALPLKDEVERVVGEIIDAPGTWEEKFKTAQSLAVALLSRLRAGEQEVGP